MELELSGCYPIILDGEDTGQVSVSREGLFWRFEARCKMREELLRLSVYGQGAEGYLGVMEPVDGELWLSKKLSRNGLSGFPPVISYATRAGETPPMLAISEGAEEAPHSEGAEELPRSEAEDFPRNARETLPTESEAPPCTESFGLPRGEAPPQTHGDTEALPQGDAGSNSPQEAESEAVADEDLPPEDDKPPPAAHSPPLLKSRANEWRHCPLPCSLFSDMGAKFVCAGISGAFMRDAEGGIILAVPEDTAAALPENNILIFSETEIIWGRRYALATVKYR